MELLQDDGHAQPAIPTEFTDQNEEPSVSEGAGNTNQPVVLPGPEEIIEMHAWNIIVGMVFAHQCLLEQCVTCAT